MLRTPRGPCAAPLAWAVLCAVLAAHAHAAADADRRELAEDDNAAAAAAGGGSTLQTPEKVGLYASLVLAASSTILSIFNGYMARQAALAARRREEKFSEEMEVFKVEVNEQKKHEERAQALEALYSLYRKPLVACAYDLQSRLKGMVGDPGILASFRQRQVHNDLPDDSGKDPRDWDYMLYNTLFVFGDFLGWVEIVRQDVVFIEGSPNLSELFDAISFQLSGETYVQGGPKADLPFPPYLHARGAGGDWEDSPDFDKGYMRCQLYAGEQRAIGEAMVERVVEHESTTGARRAKLATIGFNTFFKLISSEPGSMPTYEEAMKTRVFQRAFTSLKADLVAMGEDPGEVPRARLTALQIILVRLLDELDPKLEDLPESDSRYKPQYIEDTVDRMRRARDATDDATDDILTVVVSGALNCAKGACRSKAQVQAEEEEDLPKLRLIPNPEWTAQLIDRKARRVAALDAKECHKAYFSTLRSFKTQEELEAENARLARQNTAVVAKRINRVASGKVNAPSNSSPARASA